MKLFKSIKVETITGMIVKYLLIAPSSTWSFCIESLRILSLFYTVSLVVLADLFGGC